MGNTKNSNSAVLEPSTENPSVQPTGEVTTIPAVTKRGRQAGPKRENVTTFSGEIDSDTLNEFRYRVRRGVIRGELAENATVATVLEALMQEFNQKHSA